MKIDSLNYNQLKVLLAVYKHGQGSLAAAELGISSCAVTRTLNALRDVFMDSLFVRKSNGLIPTQKTEELIPHAKLLVEQYQLLERQHSVFSPSQSGGHFVIRAYDEFVYAVHKVIDNYILPEAPNLRFDIRTLSHDGVVDQIIRLNATAPRLSAALRDFLANRHTQSYDFV